MKNLAKLCFVITLLFFNNSAKALDKSSLCQEITKDFPIKSTEASSGLWANLRKKPGSISFESNAIFNDAKDKADKLTPPENFCPPRCKVAKRAVMFFHSVPKKLLSDYRDAEHCAELEKTTSKEPFHYKNSSITTVEQLNEWIGDLSQGDGDNGEDLYNRCDKSCSPRFQYLISLNDGEPKSYTVNAKIECGHARDKDDGQYNLNAYFRWSCEDK